MSWISFLIGFAIVVGILLTIIFRARTMMRLVKRGTHTQATVIDKKRRQSSQGGGSQAWLKYEFHAGGQIYRRGCYVSEEVFNAHEVGGQIDIMYDQQNPKINAAKYMVDLSKEALAKRRGKN